MPLLFPNINLKTHIVNTKGKRHIEFLTLNSNPKFIPIIRCLKRDIVVLNINDR